MTDNMKTSDSGLEKATGDRPQHRRPVISFTVSIRLAVSALLVWCIFRNAHWSVALFAGLMIAFTEFFSLYTAQQNARYELLLAYIRTLHTQDKNLAARQKLVEEYVDIKLSAVGARPFVDTYIRLKGAMSKDTDASTSETLRAVMENHFKGEQN